MSIHFSPKYKKDILVDKNKGIWMDYKTGNLFWDSCWLDELPVEVLHHITQKLYEGYYKNAGHHKIWKQIHPYINCSTDISIRQKHSHSRFNEMGSLDCEGITESHPYYNLYFATMCQPVNSNRHIVGPCKVIDKPEWMKNPYKKIKINGKYIKNDCHSSYAGGGFAGNNKIRVGLEKQSLDLVRVDFRTDPCPCIVKKYNDWVRKRKYNLIYEDGIVNNNEYRRNNTFKFKQACRCEDELSTNPIIMNLFTTMYRNQEMDFIKFLTKAYHSCPIILWDKFKKEARSNFNEFYTNNEEVFNRFIIKNNGHQAGSGAKFTGKAPKLECVLFNTIVNGREYGWLYRRYLDENQLKYGPPCSGITKDGLCDKKSTQTELYLNIKELGEYGNAKKLFPYGNRHMDADYNTHLHFCARCRDKYIKFKKNDKDRKVPCRITSSKFHGSRDEYFKLDRFMNDRGYKIKDGYLITTHSDLVVMDKYGHSSPAMRVGDGPVKKVDVSKIRFY
jgi:hypothetical protein